MNVKSQSTYFFIGQLTPSELCMNYHPGEIYLGNNLVLDIFQDGIAIWTPGTDESFDEIRPRINEAFEIVINTFMLITDTRLSFQLLNWVETKGIISKNNVIGFIIPPDAKRRQPKQRSISSNAWRKVGKSYLKIRNSFYHRNALVDYKLCVNSLTDDAFFYAYRILENIRNAATQNMSVSSTNAQRWEQMHLLLKTNEICLSPLTKVSKCVRHGDSNHPDLINARKDRSKLIDVAINLLRKEFKRSFKGLL